MSAPYSIVTFKKIVAAANHMGLFISPDGHRAVMYSQDVERLYSYTMSTPWDVTTLALEKSSAELWLHSDEGSDMHFTSDGMRLFLLSSNDNRVSEYAMSTAWDIATLSWVKDSAGDIGVVPSGLTFSQDGTKMYVVDYYNANFFEYNLGTPWDVATKSLAYSVAMDIGVYSPRSLWLSPDGKRLFTVGMSEQKIVRCDLATPFDLSSGVFVAEFSIKYDDFPPVYYPQTAISFSPDESMMYLTGCHDSLGCFYIYECNSVAPVSIWWTNFRGQSEIA